LAFTFYRFRWFYVDILTLSFHWTIGAWL